MARSQRTPASLLQPAQPSNPPPCAVAGCDWQAAYRDGAHGSRPYCIRHGPFASACRVCGGSEVWIDRDDVRHCATCTPQPSLTDQIAADLRAINGDADLRVSGAASVLRRVLLDAQRAERELAMAEHARPAAEQAIAAAVQRVSEAQAAPPDARMSQADRRAAIERLRQQLDDAAERERDLRTTASRAAAARDRAARRAQMVVSQLTEIRTELERLRTEPPAVAHASRLAHILGWEQWPG
jgi:hypothetical protein